MNLDIEFIYYRNYSFDGKFHIQCVGNDLYKIAGISYQLFKDNQVLSAVQQSSYASTGKLIDYGCPAQLETRERFGDFEILATVTFTDDIVRQWALPGNTRVMGPFRLSIGASESARKLGERLPAIGKTRQPRDVTGLSAAHKAPQLYQGFEDFDETLHDNPLLNAMSAFPALIVTFTEQGYERFLEDLEPDSGSWLVGKWEHLKQVIDIELLISNEERNPQALELFSCSYRLLKPASMANATFLALGRSLAALDYVTDVEFEGQVCPSERSWFRRVVDGITQAFYGIRLSEVTKPQPVVGLSYPQPTANLEPGQGYLDAPSVYVKGINARTVMTDGINGKGVRLHLVDLAFNRHHEELRENPLIEYVGEAGLPAPENVSEKERARRTFQRNHGASTAGILVAKRNAEGTTGMCHQAQICLYSTSDLFKASASLLERVRPGDIVAFIFAIQRPPLRNTDLPSIDDSRVWEMTRVLSARGATCICSAGNGHQQDAPARGAVRGEGMDLSTGHFNRRSDSGVIMVAACNAQDGKRRRNSNYGYQHAMLNAWGDSVLAPGQNNLIDLPGENRDYGRFTDTSAAGAIVAGALGMIQSYAMQHHHLYLDAWALHHLLTASGYRDAVADGDQRIGVRPNVLGALQLLDRTLGSGRYQSQKIEL